MRITSALACAGLSLVLTAPGCIPVGTSIKTKQHTQDVTVRTEPPGATVYRRDESGLHELGRSPVTLKLPYRTIQRITDKGACAANGAGRGLMAGLDAAFEDDEAGPESLILGALGLVVGAAVGASRCKKLDGPPQVERNQVELVVTKPGYYPERRRINVPRASPQLTLFLLSTESPRRAALIPPEKDQFELPPSQELRPEFVPPPLGRSKRHHLAPRPPSHPSATPALVVEVEDSEGSLPADTADRLTTALERSLDGAFADPAKLNLDTRMRRVGDLCLLSATLYSSADHQPLRVASASTGCDPKALEAAVDQLAAELTPVTMEEARAGNEGTNR